MSSLSWLSLVALGARLVSAQDDDSSYPTCLSFGMDFQNGGSYFQNSLSSDNFTFVSQFADCQDDVAYNILVDPSGDQVECSDTQLRPDDTDRLANCPLQKNQLYSGDWSVIIISNNGDADPIAYERDFSLSVGPQSTSTFTPTATATVVSTPIVNATITNIDTVTSVLDAKTVTSPSTTVTKTKTVTPARVTTTSTKALVTLKFTKYTVDIEKVTKTKTASCRTPTRASTCDPKARIRPTVGPAARHFSAKFRREAHEIKESKQRFVEERRVRIMERAPDAQPLVVTDADTAHWPTVTSTSTAAAITATVATEVTSTFTSTPPAVTVLKGKTKAPVVTITAATPTKTKTIYRVATSTTTKTIKKVYTITTTTTPKAVASACKSAGGVLY